MMAAMFCDILYCREMMITLWKKERIFIKKLFIFVSLILFVVPLLRIFNVNPQ